MKIYCITHKPLEYINKLTNENLDEWQNITNLTGIPQVPTMVFKNNYFANVIDLPGTYSVNSFSPEEEVVSNILLEKNKISPDAALVVSDIENLKHNLLLFTQVKDLGIPFNLGPVNVRLSEMNLKEKDFKISNNWYKD